LNLLQCRKLRLLDALVPDKQGAGRAPVVPQPPSCPGCRYCCCNEKAHHPGPGTEAPPIDLAIQRRDHAVHLRTEIAGVQIGRLPESEFLDVARQQVLTRHCRAIDQERNDRDLFRESCRDLHAHPVVLVVNSQFSVAVLFQPIRSYDCDQYRRALEHLPDMLSKIRADRHVVDIDKYICLAEMIPETLRNPARGVSFRRYETTILLMAVFCAARSTVRC
jgi:hypothetical protein